MHNNPTYKKPSKRPPDLGQIRCGAVRYIFPAFVLLLILAPFFFVVPFVIIPWLGLHTLSGITNLVVSTLLVVFIIISYMKSVLTAPGHPPTGWTPDVELAHEYDNLTTPEGARKFCQKCDAYKPPRTHHCRACNKCVLKMDHHCPWINNCVGQDNHKSFLLFLVYAVVGIFYALILLLICFIDILVSGGIVEDFVIIFGFTITATILFPIGLAIAMLLCWQLWLVYNNVTSIEYEEEERNKRICKKEGRPYKYVNKHNIGRIGNLRTVFGGGPWHEWILPTHSPRVDSVYFRRDHHSHVNKV